METKNVIKASAFLISAVLTIIIIGSMIILEEVDSGFKLFLNILTGHHWVTKGLFTAILFPFFSAIFFFVLRSDKASKTLRAEKIWSWALLLVAVTSLFFILSLVNYVINYFV